MSIQPQDVPDDDPDSSGLTYDLDATSIRDVRHHVRTLLGDRPGVLLDDAVLVTDELVSNAIRHGQGPRTCRLTLIGDGQGLRVEVTDTGPGRPHLRTPDTSGGRGLVLVDRLASTWGVHWFRGHTTVWAELLDKRARRAPHLAVAPEWP